MFRLTPTFGLILSRGKLKGTRYYFREASYLFEEQSNELKEVQEKQCPFSKAEHVSTLLKIAVQVPRVDRAFKALSILADWKTSKGISFAEVQKDPNFSKITAVISKEAHSRHVSQIIGAIKNLLELEVKSNHILIEHLWDNLAKYVGKQLKLSVLPFDQSLENDLIWNVRKVTLSSLFTIFNFQLKHQDTPRQEKVLEETIAHIERRWTELFYTKDVIIIYENEHHFSKKFIGNIDESVMALADRFSLIQLSKILCSLGACRRRPTPVLRTLSFHMFKSNDQLSLKQIVNTIYAMNILHFPDQAVLDKLGSDFVSQIKSLKQTSVIGALIVCMGQMRWKDVALLGSICEWIEENIDVCQLSNLTSLLLTLACNSYRPNNIEKLLDLILPKLEDFPQNNKSLWVDIVWSLVVLERAPHHMICSVLNEQFFYSISCSDPASVGTLLKLLNIDALASTMENYTGPRLKKLSNEHLLITKSKKELVLLNYLRKVLSNFIPPPIYLKTDIQTHMGFTVDAEIIMDNLGKPLPIEDYTTDFGLKKSAKELPMGGRRIALMIWHFKDYTVGVNELTGSNQLAVNIIESRNYTVVQVPYYDLSMGEKLVTTVQYFERRLRQTEASY